MPEIRPIRRPTREETEAAILDASLVLFSRRGYEATSLQEIADALEVTKGTLYYYFPEKEGLLGRLVGPFLDGLAGLLDAPPGQPRELLAAYVDLLVEHRETASLLASDVSALTVDAIRDRYCSQLEELRRLLAGPDPGEADLLRATSALGAAAHPLIALPELSPDAHRNVLLSAAMGALGKAGQ